MRIAVATDDQVTLAAHTGRCAGFAIYDISDGAAQRVDYRSNTFTAHAQGACSDHSHGHGASNHSHDGVLGALHDCSALISAGMGPRLIADLLAAGVQPHVCQIAGVEDAVALFGRGELPPATIGAGCRHHH